MKLITIILLTANILLASGYYLGTKQECEDYNQLVVQGENYGSVTSSWANIIANNDSTLFAIAKHSKYQSDMSYVVELDSTFMSVDYAD